MWFCTDLGCRPKIWFRLVLPPERKPSPWPVKVRWHCFLCCVLPHGMSDRAGGTRDLHLACLLRKCELLCKLSLWAGEIIACANFLYGISSYDWREIFTLGRHLFALTIPELDYSPWVALNSEQFFNSSSDALTCVFFKLINTYF